MSNGAKVIFERMLRNGLGDMTKQSVVQYADGSQVIVSTVLPGGKIGPETLVFLGEGGDISNFSEVAGGRGAGRHDSEVENALKFETAAEVTWIGEEEGITLFDLLQDLSAILGTTGLEDEESDREVVDVSEGTA